VLWVPPSERDFGFMQSNVEGVRPAAAFGTSVIPGASNVKAATWTTLLASTTVDTYFAVINFNSNFVTAAIRNTLCDIGLGAAASEVALIPDLLFGGADSYTVGCGGAWYCFPIFIPAGSRVSARAQVNNVTAGTFRCAIWLYGRAKDMRMIRYGTSVSAAGITAASSSGVAVTPGTTGEGAWTHITTASSPYWWWQFGVGCADTTMTALTYQADMAVGDATNKDIVIRDSRIITGATEQISVMPQHVSPQRNPGATTIYCRMQCSGTPDATISMAGYALR
jgi:hypothetical protein